MKMCHKMKVYKRGNNGDSRPEIRLLGNWLNKVGFPIGTEISVTVIYALNKKQSGLKTPIVRKNGRSLDVLRDEAEWEGIIIPGTTTDAFKAMIEAQIN